MKEEHKQALLDAEILISPTGFLMWGTTSGYFNCNDSDCSCCEDPQLTWEEVEMCYNQWDEKDWEIQ